MPLYTYIASYLGSSHAEQGSFSNFKGFAAQALGAMPRDALPDLTTGLRQEFLNKVSRCDWIAVPNRTNLWHASFDLAGSAFSVYAVQTKT